MKTLDETMRMPSCKEAFKKAAMAVMPVLTIAGSTVVTWCTDGKGIKSVDTGNLVNSICTTYRAWALPFIMIAAILWAITKDEKKKEVEKKVVIGLVIVYVLTFCGSIITGTAEDIAVDLGRTI